MSRLTASLPQVDHFQLGGSLPEGALYRELSADELAGLGASISFKGERIVDVGSIQLYGIPWSGVVGAVDSVIYKISLLWRGTVSDALNVRRRIDEQLFSELGPASESVPAYKAWDCLDGNLVLTSKQSASEAFAVLTFTSALVRTFQRADSKAVPAQQHRSPKISEDSAFLIVLVLNAALGTSVFLFSVMSGRSPLLRIPAMVIGLFWLWHSLRGLITRRARKH